MKAYSQKLLFNLYTHSRCIASHRRFTNRASLHSLPLLRLTLMNDRDYRTDRRLASSQNQYNQTQRHREHPGNFTLHKMEAGKVTEQYQDAYKWWGLLWCFTHCTLLVEVSGIAAGECEGSAELCLLIMSRPLASACGPHARQTSINSFSDLLSKAH